MKIAIPLDEKTLDSDVCVSFGRTPYFLIYDTDTKTHSFLDNSAIAAEGGAGIKAAQSIVDADVEAVITVRLGDNSANVLKAADLKLYKSVPASAKVNIEKFQKGELEVLTEIHAGFHQHGGM